MLSDLPPSDMQSNPRAAHTQIPSEILEHIFADCVHSTSDAVGHDHTQCFRSNLEVPPWIAITYVCRRWRQISIGYKFLWTHIAGSFSAEWITIFLQRSAPVPLDVDLSLHSWSRQQDLLQLFQAEMHRVRNLYVRSRFTVSDAEPIHRQLDVFVSTFAGTPAPALTSLTIDIPPLRFYDMPSVLFNTNAPRLQRLSLSRGIYPTDPESRLYASLLHLQIDSEYTFAQLAALGTSMPLLQTAVIGSVKTGLLRMDEPGLVEPALTSLRRLHMRKWDAFVFGLPHLLRLAPNLEELRIQRCQRDTPHPPPPAPLHSQEPDLVVQHAAQSLKRLYMPLYALAQAEALLAIPFGPAIQLHLHLKSRDEGRDVYARLAGLLEGRRRMVRSRGSRSLAKGEVGSWRLAFLEDGGGTLTDYEGRVGEERGIAAVVPVDVGEEDVGDVGGL
ncbi:hypothetical protein EVG20_g4186 [Dentipellis fragilis]|uniref:Uncharacterized protein n=1 Tax=Dentipellis fragilis TaxID=205917 RepID=A0A4Y9Z0J0_9AGAM|nr:hypothetical protein EVG20_g4186 [Dentipellis fragilis]